MSNYPGCQRLFMYSFRGLWVSASDLRPKTCRPVGDPEATALHSIAARERKPLLLRVKSKKRSYFFHSFLYFASTPKTCLSVCVKNYGRSKTMRKRWCRLRAVNEDVPRLVEVEISRVFLNTYSDLPRSSHAPLSNLLFYWLSIACTAIVSGLGFIVCFIRLI